MEENKNMCGQKKPEHYNHGINCDAKNCVYHAGEKHCTAKCISVGPMNAQTSADTICSTFKQKGE